MKIVFVCILYVGLAPERVLWSKLGFFAYERWCLRDDLAMLGAAVSKIISLKPFLKGT